MIDVVVDTSSLNRSRMGSVTGQVFLQGPTGSFPEDHWSDFPVVILCWWIEGLQSVVAGEECSFQGMFMDGPFAFVVQRGEGGFDRIAWGPTEEETPVGIVEISSLLLSVVAAGRIVADACRERDWSGHDLELLEKAIAAATKISPGC